MIPRPQRQAVFCLFIFFKGGLASEMEGDTNKIWKK
jgi:hypothetical protein